MLLAEETMPDSELFQLPGCFLRIIFLDNLSLPLIGAVKLLEPSKFTCTLVSPLVTIKYHKETGKSIWNII